MQYFHYAGTRDGGLSVQGWLVADDRESAIATLQQRQIQPLYVRQGPGQIPLRVPAEELLASLRELASLRGSGMALDQAVMAVAETAEQRELKRAWHLVGQSIRSGLSLSDAFAAAPQAFPRYAIPMVRLGEANGELHSVLQAVADRLEEEMNLRNEVRSALTYPAFLLVVSVAVLLFLFLVVIPKFGEMISEVGSGTPSMLGTLVGIANLTREYFWLWGSLSLAGIAYLVHEYKSGHLQERLWAFLQRIPGVKGLIDAWEIVQFCGSMRRLLPQGVPILEALQLSSETLARDDVRRRLALAVGSMRRGETLANSLSKQKVFTPLVLQMISVGEASASLSDSMAEVSKLYERRLREGIRRILALLEPAVIVTLGLMVGGIMVLLMSGIMSMDDLPM
jgi:type II secretory pathway component PulF